MKEHREVKPVVEFAHFLGWESWGDARRAVVMGVRGHPRLGEQPIVYTSRVLSVDGEDSPTLIETLNTIYKKQS